MNMFYLLKLNKKIDVVSHTAIAQSQNNQMQTPPTNSASTSFSTNRIQMMLQNTFRQNYAYKNSSPRCTLFHHHLLKPTLHDPQYPMSRSLPFAPHVLSPTHSNSYRLHNPHNQPPLPQPLRYNYYQQIPIILPSFPKNSQQNQSSINTSRVTSLKGTFLRCLPYLKKTLQQNILRKTISSGRKIYI